MAHQLGIGRLEHVERLGRPVEVQEQLARPRDRHPGDLLGVGGPELREHRLGVGDPTLARQGLGEDQAGVRAAGPARRPRQAFRQPVIEPPQRLAGQHQELLGLARQPRLEPPGRQPQPVELIEVVDGPDQLADDGPAPQAGQ